MQHGQATPRLKARDPMAARISALSHEYLSADPVRKQAIGEEVRALIERRVLPLAPRRRTLTIKGD
ncbi:MAG: hypothetical protein AAFX00_11700 [Pseudomonadota bacterium]